MTHAFIYWFLHFPHISLHGPTWVRRHNLIGNFLLREISLADTWITGSCNPTLWECQVTPQCTGGNLHTYAISKGLLWNILRLACEVLLIIVFIHSKVTCLHYEKCKYCTFSFSVSLRLMASGIKFCEIAICLDEMCSILFLQLAACFIHNCLLTHKNIYCDVIFLSLYVHVVWCSLKLDMLYAITVFHYISNILERLHGILSGK